MTTYTIQTRSNGSQWTSEGLAACESGAASFATEAGAEIAIDELRAMGGEWAEAEYRVVEDSPGAFDGTVAEATIEVVHVRPSICCDAAGAVDADVTIGDIEGEVTLVPSDYDGQLTSWGSLDHWASASLHGLDKDTLGEIVAAVREEAARDAAAQS